MSRSDSKVVPTANNHLVSKYKYIVFLPQILNRMEDSRAKLLLFFGVILYHKLDYILP